MRIEFDPGKRELTLATRALDFVDAERVFARPHITLEDRRREYGESRFLTFGMLNRRMVAIGWTPRYPGGEQV